MAVNERAQRLKIDSRLAILDNITALNMQRKAARQAGQADVVKAIANEVDILHDQLDELSFISLRILEDSDVVKGAIKDLRAAVAELEDEADTITNIATALNKGAKIVDQGAKLIVKLRGFVPA